MTEPMRNRPTAFVQLDRRCIVGDIDQGRLFVDLDGTMRFAASDKTVRELSLLPDGGYLIVYIEIELGEGTVAGSATFNRDEWYEPRPRPVVE